MPALVLFKRRWKLGSDDLVIPAAILAAIHMIWTTVLAYMLVISENSPSDSSHWITSLRWFVIGLMAIFPASLVLEVAIAVSSGRGGPLKTNMRSNVSTLLYLRLGVLGIELFWEILSVVRLFLSSDNKPSSMMLSIVGGFLLFNWLVTFTVIGQFGKAPPLRDNLKCSGLNRSCSFHPLNRDEISSEKAAGRTSMGGGDGSGIYSSINEALCRGGAMSNSLIGQALANNSDGDGTACMDSGFYGFHEICCFSVPSKRNSYSELERVISFMLGDLDLVQSDIVTGLVLFKRSQKSIQDMTITEPSNEVYQFLSGTPITSTTRFLGFKSQGSVEFYSRVVRFMKYPLATHRLTRSTVFKKFRSSRGCGNGTKRCTCCHKSRIKNPKRLNSDRIQTLQLEPVEKELANLIGQKQFELLHCSLLNADLDGMSFLVGLDHEVKAVVVCVWSAICLKDAFVKMCSNKATSQCVIVRPDWFVSEYFAMLADKIYSRLRNDNLLLQALSRDQLSGTECYELIVTGQSLAGGVACVLAVLLKQFYHNLHCFAYAPPNSIFNAVCVRETQSFITSVVVGKDIVPRLSCNQIEAFRQSLVSCLRSCNSHKLRILCSRRPSACCPDHQPPETAQTTMEHLGREGDLFNKSTGLYLPGKVVHIVRSRPKISCSNRMSQCKRHSVFQAVWARNEDFKDILVSRKMISDHCPFLIMDALEKVLTHISPAKPVRKGVSSKRGHHRPIISANSSHNETTLTSQNTVSDFSTSEQLIESTYAPATLSMGLTEIPHPSVQEFFNQSMTLTGNISEPHFGLDVPAPYERINNQTFPKVKMRSSRPSEFANRVIRIMPQQLSSNGGPSGQHTAENFYNTINVPNHFASMTSDSMASNPAKIRTTATNHFLAGEQSNKRQPILIDNWTGAFAPLASPEALSESSSLASCGEQSSSGYPVGFVAGLPGHRGDSIKRLSSGAAYQRLVARIDPIRQSPLGPIHPFSGGWIDSGSADTASSHKDLPERIKKSSLTSKSNTGSLRSRSTNQEQGSVKGDEELTKDLRDFGAFLSHDPLSKESYYAEIGEPSDGPSNHVAGPKSDSLYDLIMDASSPVEEQARSEEPEGKAKADSDLMVFSPPSSGEHLRAKSAMIVLPTTDSPCKDSISQQEQQTLRQFETVAVSTVTGAPFECEPIYSKVIPRPERKSENQENTSKDVPRSPVNRDVPPELRRCSPEEKDVAVDSNAFFCDSDDDYEEAQEQFIYDLMIGHYSCAGRGYPHGFIESYSKTANLSVAEEVAEAPPNIF